MYWDFPYFQCTVPTSPQSCLCGSAWRELGLQLSVWHSHCTGNMYTYRTSSRVRWWGYTHTQPVLCRKSIKQGFFGRRQDGITAATRLPDSQQVQHSSHTQPLPRTDNSKLQHRIVGTCKWPLNRNISAKSIILWKYSCCQRPFQPSSSPPWQQFSPHQTSCPSGCELY